MTIQIRLQEASCIAPYDRICFLTSPSLPFPPPQASSFAVSDELVAVRSIIEHTWPVAGLWLLVRASRPFLGLSLMFIMMRVVCSLFLLPAVRAFVHYCCGLHIEIKQSF